MNNNVSTDAQWLRTVVDRFEVPLVRYATRLVGDVDLARDIVQDTFLKLCRQDAAAIRPILAPWLFRVCRNRALDVLKKEHRMNSLSPSQAAAQADHQPGQAATAERNEAAATARALLAELPVNQQEVIRLKLDDDLSYREISEITGLSVSNVGYLIHVGMMTLRDRFFRHTEPTRESAT